MSLLVVEDELKVRNLLVQALKAEGFDIRDTGNGAEGASLIESENFELALIDWGLPGMNGIEILQQVRGKGNITPIVMLTARDALQDRIRGLDAGADDYLIKPFEFDELLARIRAVMRRTGARHSPVLQYEDLSLNPLTRRVSRGGKDIRLTAREFALLQFFLEHPEEVLSRSRIVEAVWEHDFETFSNVVEVYIRYLRTKMDEPFERKLIHTVRGVGYVLRKEP